MSKSTSLSVSTMPRSVCDACTFSSCAARRWSPLRLAHLGQGGLRHVARLLRGLLRLLHSFSRADSRIFWRSTSPALMRVTATCSCARCSATRAVCVAGRRSASVDISRAFLLAAPSALISSLRAVQFGGRVLRDVGIDSAWATRCAPAPADHRASACATASLSRLKRDGCVADSFHDATSLLRG